MKTIILLLILSSSTIIYSQTIEPTPHSFNWGAYTAPFHDSSHSQHRMVMGWQWGGNDTSFDRFMGVNTVHDHNQLTDFWHAKYNDDTVKQIYELDAIKVVGITSRFDGETSSNLSSAFQPNRYDSSGAVFGWSNRNISIVSNVQPHKPAHADLHTCKVAQQGWHFSIATLKVFFPGLIWKIHIVPAGGKCIFLLQYAALLQAQQIPPKIQHSS